MAIDNKVDQFSENINKAIEIHVQNAITGLEFNKTEQAEIVDVSNAAAGDYIVSNGSARYHAFANEANYTLGTKVNVLIPNNDYGQQKLILGKAKRSTTQSLSYVSPLEGYEPKTKNIVEDEEKFIVPSWTITKTIENDVEKIEADESIKPDIFKVDDYLQEAAKITDDERKAGKRVEIPLDETFLMIPEIYFDRKEPIEIIKKVTEETVTEDEGSKTITTTTTDYAINKSDSNFISVYGASREGDKTVPMEHGTNKLIYFSEDLSIKNSVNTEENNSINQNYKYMGLSAQFKTAFNDDIRVVSGDYGIDIVILYSKKNQDLNQSRLYFTRTYRMSAADMLGSIYDFSTGHIQEALFELETDQKEDVLIHRIAILLHQDGKFKYLFKNGSRETFPIIKYENEEGENRVYVSNIELRLGNQLDTRYKFDSVSIHTEDGAYYDSAQVNDKNIQKTIILDWTHTDPNTGLKTTFTRVPREVSNQVDDSVATITWFRDYHYSVSQYRTDIETASDDYDALSLILEEYQTFYEQNFAWITTWETEASKDEPSKGNNYWESFKSAQRDIYKKQYDENRDTDYIDADAYADAKVKAIEQEVRNMNGSLVRLINELKLKSGTHYYYDPVNKAIMLTKSGREAAERKINRDSKTIVSAMNADAQLAGDGWVAIGTKKENTMEIDFTPDRTVNTCKVKCVIQYGPVDSDGNYITSNPYYRVLESNELIFTNLTSVPDVSTWDVSAGLQFYFKDKSNGFYPLYDYTGALIDQQNANKTRTLEVDMRTTLFGDSYIEGNEIIIWRLPRNNSMLDFSANLVDDIDEKRTEGDETVSITYGPHQVKELTSEEVNNLLGSHGVEYEENFIYLKYEANDSNNTVENRDKDGNIQYEKGKEGEDKVDEEGYKLDEAGQRIPILKTVTARNYIKYKIKEIYKPYFYNNTVSCFLIKSNTNGFFTGSTEISFSNKGNNGTDYTLVLTLGETFTVDNLVTYDEVISDQVPELRRLIDKYSGDIVTTEALIAEIENKENPTTQEEEDLKDYKTQLEILKKKKFDYERTLELDKETIEEIEAESEKETYNQEDLDEEYVEEASTTNGETTPSNNETQENTSGEESGDGTTSSEGEGEELPKETTFEDNSFKDLRTLPNIYVSNDWVKAGPPEEAITLGEEKFHRIIFEVHDADGLKIDLTNEQKNDIISSWVGALNKGYYAGVQNVKNLDFLCKLETTKKGEEFINNFTDIAVRANPGITTEESDLVIDGETSPSSDEDLKTLEDFKYIVMQLELNTSLFEDEEEDIIDFDSENKAFSLSNVNLLTLLPLNFRVNKEDSVQGSNFLYYDDNGSLSKKYPFGYYLNNQSFEEQQGNISTVYNLVMQKLTEAREEKEKLISTLRDVYKSYMDAAAAELPESVKEDTVEDGVPMETSLTEEQQILQEFEKLLESQLKNDYSWLFQDIKDPQIDGDYWFRSDASKQDFINNINYFIENLDEAFDDDEDIKLFGEVFLSRPYANWLRYILHKDFRAEYTTDIDQDHLDEAVFRSKYNKKLVKKKLDAAKKKYQNNVSKKTKATNKAIKPLKTKLNKAESQLKKIDAQIKKYLEYYSLEKDGDTPKYFTVKEDSFTATSGQIEFILTETPVLDYFCVSINDVLQTNTKETPKYSISGKTLKLENAAKENDIIKCTYYNYNPIVIENSQWKRNYSVSIKPLEDILNAIEEQDKKIKDANDIKEIILEKIPTEYKEYYEKANQKGYYTVAKTAKQTPAYDTTSDITSDLSYDRTILLQDWYATDATDLQEIQIKIARFFNDFDDSGDEPVFKLSSNLTTTEKKEKNNYIDKFNKLKKDKVKAQQKIIDKAKKDKKAQQKKLKNYVKGAIKEVIEEGKTISVQLKETDSVADWRAFIYNNVDTKELNEANIAKINKITTYYTDIEKKIKSSLSGNKDKKLRYEHLKNRYSAQIEKKNEDLKEWKDTYYYPSRENPIRFESKRNDEYKDYRGVKDEKTGEYSDYPNPSDPEIEGFEKKLYIDVLNDCYVIWNLNGVVPKTITSYTISVIMASANEFRKKLNEFKDKNYEIPDPKDIEKTKSVDIIEYWDSFYQILVSAKRKLGWFDISVGVYNRELDEPIYEDLRAKYTLSADKQKIINDFEQEQKPAEDASTEIKEAYEKREKQYTAYKREKARLAEEESKALQYYPSIEKKHTLKALSFYSDGLNTNISILCYEETDEGKKGNLLYIMPLVIIRSTHDIASINKWNGKAMLDKDGNQIMSSLMAAGTKDKNNNFTGVIIGDIEPNGTKSSYSSAKMNGIYGYHAGVQSFGIKTDGTSFLGKEGMGRIEFDGNKGTIQSGGYSVDDKMGTKIDLVTGDIDLYTRPPHWYEQYEDEDGNVELIQTDSYGDNLEDPDSKYAHIHIGGNSPDSSEQDSYFSVSAPSTIKDLDNGDYANEENTPLIHIGQHEYFLQTADYDTESESGLRIDLTDGTFDSKGKFTLKAGEGSSITFGTKTPDTDLTTPYFNISQDGVLTCKAVKILSGDVKAKTTEVVNNIDSDYIKLTNSSSDKVQLRNSASDAFTTGLAPTKITIITSVSLVDGQIVPTTEDVWVFK